MTFTEEEFINILKKISTKETSFDPDRWSPENPLWGHCAVVSLLAQEYFGGKIVRGSLLGNKEYSHLKSHFWNRFPDEREIDFTENQYSDFSFHDLLGVVVSRESVLESPRTQERYNLLKRKLLH